MPRKVFTAGEILTAADVNTNLMDQAVMVFADSTARGSAIPSPSEGMITYLEDTDAVEKYDGSSFVAVAPPITRENLPDGTILQVVEGTTTTVLTTTTGTWQSTNLSATITPTSVDSKVLVLVNQGVRCGENNRIPVSALDSPATTSAVVYSTEGNEVTSGAGIRILRDSTVIRQADRVTDGSSTAQFNEDVSVITLLEVAG